MGFISGLFKDKNQKYLENLKKNNKIREEEEQEKAEIFTIGKVDKEIHEKKDIEGALAQGSEEMKAIRASREKELKEIQDQLFIINEAKVKFGPHIGTFKVLSDTPTIQSKTVGTQIENTPLNFTFEDGFQLLTLTQWQDVGDAKFQDQLALIKKSILSGTGRMPYANAPEEKGQIEFINSGQINEPENIDTTGMPMPEYVSKRQKVEFLVIFERLSTYDGEFGFDWMRKEYLPISEGGQGICVEGLEELRKIYTPFNIVQDTKLGELYENYYVPWLTMFPNHQKK